MACPGETPATAPERLRAFCELVRTYYRDHGRDLPWRRTRDPYEILVSEMMLQQTQVTRVIPKYQEFLTAFPSLEVLAETSVAHLLSVWQGLGYNRRALFLQKTAGILVRDHEGIVPAAPDTLRRLPGVGPATAAAVCVFAHDVPLVFIETNIRTAFIHCFFEGCASIPDAAILPLVDLTLDRDDPRSWYYALMDYGAWVKRSFANPGRRSRHHATQSPFEGSGRQLRAAVLRALVSASPAALSVNSVQAAVDHLGPGAIRVAVVLGELVAEGFLARSEDGYRIV